MKKITKIKLLDNKGFAISGIIYSVFILILLLMVGILATLQNRKSSLDKLKFDTLNAFETGGIRENLDELDRRVQSLENDNTSLKTLILSNNTAGLHNAIFRGNDITSYYTNGSLYNRIAGNDYVQFDDLYVGDYFVTTNNGHTVTWRIAGFDLFLNKGESNLATHHVVIVPDSSLVNANMNDQVDGQDVTTNGYAGSKMFSYLYNANNPNGTVYKDYIEPIFGGYVLEFQPQFSNYINEERINNYGMVTGASSDWGAYSRKLDLMSESEVFGTNTWSSSGYDGGNTQFPLFGLAPEYINASDGAAYWLRNVANKHNFVLVGRYGLSTVYASSQSVGVRPYFLIGITS